MNKMVLSILALALLAVPVAAQDSVYLNPQHSSTRYCSTVEVEIWVNATNLGSGQINLTYDPDCANVTNWTRDTANFQMGGESYYTGRIWITFMAMGQLTGDYRVGTLTIHCVNEGECKTPLAFADGSKLFDEGGSEITPIWINGIFECVPPNTCGDLTNDGTVDMGDVMELLYHVGAHGAYEWRADVNCDGKVNIGDVILLLNHVVGDPDVYELGCCE